MKAGKRRRASAMKRDLSCIVGFVNGRIEWEDGERLGSGWEWLERERERDRIKNEGRTNRSSGRRCTFLFIQPTHMPRSCKTSENRRKRRTCSSS